MAGKYTESVRPVYFASLRLVARSAEAHCDSASVLTTVTVISQGFASIQGLILGRPAFTRPLWSDHHVTGIYSSRQYNVCK